MAGGNLELSPLSSAKSLPDSAWIFRASAPYVAYIRGEEAWFSKTFCQFVSKRQLGADGRSMFAETILSLR